MHPRILKTEAELQAFWNDFSFDPQDLEKKFPEWLELQKISRALIHSGEVHVLGSSQHRGQNFPLLGFQVGSKDPSAPVLGLFGGVHGLERIGAQVCLSLMNSFAELVLWDKLLQEALKKIRVVFFPIVNPWGLYQQTRCNPRGVDLMRNSPVESAEKTTWLVGGHRISPRLPWYRGTSGEGLEAESQALVDFVRATSFQSSQVVHVDFHSGFGTEDRIWFPYARTKRPFPQLAEMHALTEAFARIHPHHFYKIEPQALNYTTHGDLWDYLHDEYKLAQPNGVYLPLAIEMGSWMWVRKNPQQIFSLLGAFNPLVPHRQRRTLRRHHTFFDFLIRAMNEPLSWIPANVEQKESHQIRAMDRWYPHLTSDFESRKK